MKSFRFRILVLVLGLAIVPLGATMYAISWKADDAAMVQASTELGAGALVARESLKFRGQQMALMARVLAADFGFKEAIASGDHATIQSALNNHGSRLHADVLAVFDLDGKPIAAANKDLSSDAIAILSEQSENAGSRNSNGTYSILDGIPYVLVTTTVRAPNPIAKAVLGFAINDALAADIAHIVGMDIVFIARDSHNRIVSSSSSNINGINPFHELDAHFKDLHQISAGESDLLVQREPLTATNGTLMFEVVESRSHAARTYRELQTAMLVIGATTCLAALILGFWLTRNATRPIDALTSAAERIEQGDYTTITVDKSTTEFRKLGAAFATMRAAVSEREQRIIHQSQHDKLTGLPNYDALIAMLTSRINASSNDDNSIALIVVELIQFADLNAALGHDIGDQVLCEVGRRLNIKVSHSGMVARVGSKQFVLMLPEIDVDAALLLGHDVLRVIRAPITVGEIPVTVHARCGIACYPHHGRHAEDLLRRTDLALLQAQQTESSIACFDPTTEEKHQRRIQVLGDLQDAIENNQLTLMYQPKVDLADRSISGCEVLVRWKHPVHGPVSPAEFIPHAERTGLIRRLTRWVLNTAIAQLANWQRTGLELNIAVNLSAADITDVNFCNEVMPLLKQYNIPAEQLTLEITESAAMKNTDTALLMIAQLRLHGIKFSIDDFGTGHSSLAQLRRLPVDELKLEGSLVADLIVEERARTIVNSMTALSHNLGMTVVAEGIENAQMLRAVINAGCDVAQGYLIARPMSAADLESWLRTQSITDSLANTMTVSQLPPLAMSKALK